MQQDIHKFTIYIYICAIPCACGQIAESATYPTGGIYHTVQQSARQVGKILLKGPKVGVSQAVDQSQ